MTHTGRGIIWGGGGGGAAHVKNLEWPPTTKVAPAG
eukprot:CAMPEP_0113703200 /NCGR_PEP_ID=MMETSP0038_2-20120614/25698_1 /TAXON_ID=2898 /ORGANISM="Cryptomonas paramecium" /LENGTH=35 /DNA_ID=CAMNT_0000627577 /DNA_START=317 /DNA_END=421 /DNA_ORIENTATION=- /assembly_acc=CAM_ASM_000170